MNLLYLVLYQSCNQKCKHCPMEKWIYEPDECFEDGRRKNMFSGHGKIDMLQDWISKYIDPNEWLIEITGGEPGMLPDISPFIFGLQRRNYKGLIKTNGTLPIPKTNNFKRIAAWHKCNIEMPKYYDLILILKNPNDNWQDKEKYCIKNDIPHVCFNYNTYIPEDKEGVIIKRNIYGIIKNMSTVFASGDMTGCFSGAPVEGKSVFKMSEPEICQVKKQCPWCPNIEGFEYFITNPFVSDFIKYISVYN